MFLFLTNKILPQKLCLRMKQIMYLYESHYARPLKKCRSGDCKMQFRISFFWDDLKFDSHMYICNKIKKLENEIISVFKPQIREQMSGPKIS